jgi:hypothetical protein
MYLRTMKNCLLLCNHVTKYIPIYYIYLSNYLSIYINKTECLDVCFVYKSTVLFRPVPTTIVQKKKQFFRVGNPLILAASPLLIRLSFAAFIPRKTNPDYRVDNNYCLSWQ